ncbi:MAG: ATP-binding protein, partial [Gammaproteobacteria bacterium]|nr:ATP-binding protein [Gammaproteobacteria bacterium]
LGAMDVGLRGVEVNLEELPEPSLQTPDSGLYAVLLDASGAERWRSPSFLEEIPEQLTVRQPQVGKWQFDYLRAPRPLLTLLFAVRWAGESISANAAQYAIVVIRDAQHFETQQNRFQQTLWLWLVVSAGLLMAVQFVVLRWGLMPLRRVVRQVREIESGDREKMSGNYPTELRSVVDSLNGLIAHEARQRSRYRNALDDLAHSLKTPLAALRAYLDGAQLDRESRQRADEQISRMDGIVRYQLSKAAAAGGQVLRKPVAVAPVVSKLVSALRKVHRDKPINYQLPDDTGTVRAEQDDLLELLGNLLENAARHCKSCVSVSVHTEGDIVSVLVDDDGPGFPADAELLLGRGVRADSRDTGQGLGLAMVADIVAAYAGTVSLTNSPMGGARVIVNIPT